MAKQKNSAIKNILQQLILDAFAEQMQQNFNYKQIEKLVQILFHNYWWSIHGESPTFKINSVSTILTVYSGNICGVFVVY